MNKRQARKIAYELAIGALESAIARGIALSVISDGTPNKESDVIAGKIQDEINLIIGQLRIKYERFSDVELGKI